MNGINRSKKHVAVIMTLMILLSMIPMLAMADGHEMTGVAFRVDVMGYWVDGEWVASDVAPYIQDNRIMVPVAHAARALGAEVAWDGDHQTVTVTKGESVVRMTIDNDKKIVNGEVVLMDTVPVIKDLGNGLGRTMLPVSWLAKALEVSYTWHAETSTATFMPDAEEVVEPVVFDEAGTFGPASGSITIDNDVIIAAADVVLRNYVITGDLIIAEEVGEGNVTLNNITVEGELIVRGGGEDSIHINGGSIKTLRIEATSSGAVRIVAVDAEGMEVIVAEQAADRKIILEGTFERVTIEATNVVIETRGETVIKEKVIAATAANVTVILSAETVVEKAVVESKTVTFEGEGTVKATEGSEKDTVTFGENVTQPVAPRPTPGGGGGGGGGTPPAPTIRSVVIVGEDHEARPAITSDMTVSLESNKTYSAVKVQISHSSRVTVEGEGRTISADIGGGSVITIDLAWLNAPGHLTGDSHGISGDGVLGSTLDGKEFTVTLANNNGTTTYNVTFETNHE